LEADSGRSSRCEEDRHHADRAAGERRVSDHPDGFEEHTAVRPPRVGEGLRRSRDLLLAALRRAEPHPERQHQLLAGRHHAPPVQDVARHGRLHQRPERRLATGQVRGRARPAEDDLLREAGRVPDDQGRPVGPLPAVLRGQDHEQPRDALPVRSVPDDAGLEPDLRQRLAGPGEREWRCRRLLAYVVRRVAWTAIVILAVIFVTFLVFFKLPNGNPAVRFAGKSPTQAQIHEVEVRMHLDRPFYVEFGYFVKNFLAGDADGWPGLGYSYANYLPVR